MLDSVCLQCRHILNLSCPDRVEMDVCDKLLEIGILLTENRFVAVLKKMPVSVMSPIELHRIACQKPTHDRCNRNSSSAKKEMHMIGHQCPCITGRILLLQKTGQPFKKIFPIFIISENRSALDSSDDNMMQGARGIDAGLAGHASQIPASHLLVNKETTSLFPHAKN